MNKLAYILYEDMLEGCDRVTAVFDHNPSEEEIETAIYEKNSESNWYIAPRNEFYVESISLR
jgi:hypothetical protein